MNDNSAIVELTRRVEALERNGRFWRRLALATLAVLAMLAAFNRPMARSLAVQNLPEDHPEEPREEAELSDIEFARQRLELSKQAIGIIQDAARKGVNIINQRLDFYRWSYRMLGDQIYLSMDGDNPRVADPEVFLAVSETRPNPSRLAAFEDHLKRMRVWEDIMRPLYRQEILPPIAFLDIQAHRLEAQLWLARERMKEPSEARNNPDPKEEQAPEAAASSQPS